MGKQGNGELLRGRTAIVICTVYLLSLVFLSQVVQGKVPDSLPVRVLNRCSSAQVCPSSFYDTPVRFSPTCCARGSARRFPGSLQASVRSRSKARSLELGAGI